jgi:pentatricopeptide repeat protein
MAEQNVKNLQAAMRLLEEMENDAAAQPNEITYTSILTGLYRGKWLPPGQAEIYRRDIIARMEKRRIKFKSWGYSIIIKACLESEDPRGLEDALKFYREMPRVGVLPTEDTWYILLAGLSRRGEWQLADEVVSDLLASSANPPKGTVLRLINTIRQHPQR